MGSTAVEKTAEELRKEIEELHRQQWEITERLRDPRGLRRGVGNGPRNFGTSGAARRGFVRPADRVDSEDQPPAKRRLSSAVVKIEDGEVVEATGGEKDVEEKASAVEDGSGGDAATENERDRRPLNPQLQNQRGGIRRDRRAANADLDIPTEQIPRVLPKDEDPRLVNRNRRMLGQLLGTLEKFQKEDMHLSATEAYMRRSNSLQRAEQRAREESEKLRQQEREQIAEKRKRDLTLRARVAAKAEEKKLELLFLQWRTKTEPPIFYLPAKPLEDDLASVEERKEKAFLEWKAARREELSTYQKQIAEQYIANVETELQRWQNARNSRKANNNMNLQETMDKELETHRLEHGPKTRKIPGTVDNDDEDVEDINVGEDDMMMDDVLEVDDAAKPEADNTSPSPDNLDQ
uniref:Pinin/SDK/MemA protein domain-containing protein n=1 Tax=Nelumbo nucifera TaxID=4432 RepID=A0A822ZCX8_NELNU|nr:TPA_asm: hypothetical protein HUJ06_013731 [Nelumbo nucifera]